jgi:PTH1 family peptidyl-tRNA hydrolase
MKLIFALGNPEAKYDGTRHNIGFFIVDELADMQGLNWQLKTKFKANVAEGDGFILAKPTTYYNLVGESARAIADFYKIAPEDILVIHDDIALPVGTVRSRLGGSSAGNNGIKSLNQHLGDSTARLRIGTWNELADRMDAADFVLSKIGAKDSETIKASLPAILSIIDNFIGGNFEPTTHR